MCVSRLVRDVGNSMVSQDEARVRRGREAAKNRAAELVRFVRRKRGNRLANARRAPKQPVPEEVGGVKAERMVCGK